MEEEPEPTPQLPPTPVLAGPTVSLWGTYLPVTARCQTFSLFSVSGLTLEVDAAGKVRHAAASQFDGPASFYSPVTFTSPLTCDNPAKLFVTNAGNLITNYAPGGAGTAGRRAFVTDSTLPLAGNAGTAVAGGGSNKVPVYDDGVNWRIG